MVRVTEMGSFVVVVGGLSSHSWFVVVAGAKIAVLFSAIGRGPGCAGCGETHHFRVYVYSFLGFEGIASVECNDDVFGQEVIWRLEVYDRRVRAFCAVRGCVYAVVFNR